MKLTLLSTSIIISFFFTSCEKKPKEDAKTPASTKQSTKEPAKPATPGKPKKSGIPAVEATRAIGKDLEKNAQKSNKLLKDAMDGQ